MKTKVNGNSVFCGIIFVLFLFVAGISSCQNNPVKEMYPGQSIYTQTDQAHRYVRENIVNKSNFSVESKYFADIKLYLSAEDRTKNGTPVQRVRKLMFGVNGVATAIKDHNGYLITVKHVLDTTEAEAQMTKIVKTIEKRNPGMFLDGKLIAEYNLVDVHGTSFLAFISALDTNDLGLLNVKDPKFSAPGLALSKETELADKSVFIVGDPLGIHDVILDGRIANGKMGKTEDLGKSMYVVAPIVPGNSGGAVVLASDLNMIGVVSAVKINEDPESLTSYALFVPNTVIEKFLEKNLPKQ